MYYAVIGFYVLVCLTLSLVMLTTEGGCCCCICFQTRNSAAPAIPIIAIARIGHTRLIAAMRQQRSIKTTQKWLLAKCEELAKAGQIRIKVEVLEGKPFEPCATFRD